MKSISKLPEKWCIKLTPENQKIVGEFYNKQTGEKDCYTCKAAIDQYVASHHTTNNKSITAGNVGASFYCKPTKEQPEITFEDFKTWVLGLDEANEEEVLYEIY